MLRAFCFGCETLSGYTCRCSPVEPLLVRFGSDDVRCRQWVDSVLGTLSLKERIGQLFIYTIAPYQDKGNKELLRKVVEDYKVGGLLFSGGLMQNQPY